MCLPVKGASSRGSSAAQTSGWSRLMHGAARCCGAVTAPARLLVDDPAIKLLHRALPAAVCAVLAGICSDVVEENGAAGAARPTSSRSSGVLHGAGIPARHRQSSSSSCCHTGHHLLLLPLLLHEQLVTRGHAVLIKTGSQRSVQGILQAVRQSKELAADVSKPRIRQAQLCRGPRS